VQQMDYGTGPQVSLKALLEAGVHFGHQAKRWNPKMKPTSSRSATASTSLTSSKQ
jgi:ribosomal protein S2